MNNRKKIIAIGLAVLIIFSGVIYAKNKTEEPETNNKFEITENIDSEQSAKDEINNEKTDTDIEAETLNEVEMPKELKTDQAEEAEMENTDHSAAKIDFEKLMAAHPETKSIYEEYKVEKENIKGEENEAKKLNELKKNYYPFIMDKVKADLEAFANTKEFNLLLVNQEAVIGQKSEKEMTNIKDQTDQFIEFIEAK